MNDDLFFISCPTCHKQIKWNGESPHRPFCSKRCQLIDLGEWADEKNRIADSSDDETEKDNWSENEA